MNKIIERILQIMVITMVVTGYVYVAWSSQVQSKEATMVLGAWAEMIQENNNLKKENKTERMWNESCDRWRQNQGYALSLWRSGYLGQHSEDSNDHIVEFELGVAGQMTWDPYNFEEELEIINKLKQRDEAIADREVTIKACLKERHDFMKEAIVCQKLLKKEI